MTRPSSDQVDLGAYRFAPGARHAQIDGFDPHYPSAPSATINYTNSYHTVPLDSKAMAHLPSPTHAANPIYQPPSSSKLSSSYHSPVKQRDGLVPQILSWRLDPDESLSDWILTVVSNPKLSHSDEIDSDSEEEDERDDVKPKSEGKLSSKKYFVHRTQLAVGPRRSEFFTKLFQRRAKSSSAKRRGTRIELRPSAANAFPTMLDFMYSPVGSPVQVTTESAVALRHLSTCFGIRELFEAVTDFIRKDMSAKSAPTYLLEANAFRNDKLSQIALRLCAEQFETIKFGRLVNLTPDLFTRVVSSELLVCSSELLSTRVAAYCRCRPGAITAENFKILTDHSRMPEIAPEESLFFLHLIAEMDDDAAENTNDDDDDDNSYGRRNSLYKRSIRAATDTVRKIINGTVAPPPSPKKKGETRPARNASKEYTSLPPTMKVDLLEHALAGAPTQKDLNALVEARREQKKKQEHITAKQISLVESEVEKMKRKYEKKVAMLEARVETQEDELQAYVAELAKFVRVPNGHRASDRTSEYTFQAHAEFDDMGNSLYGQRPPTCLPRFGHRSPDGWIIRDEQWNREGGTSVAYWPVYYYRGDTS